MSVRTWIPGFKRPKHVANRIFEIWNAWSITSAVSERLCGICLSTGLTTEADLVLEQTRSLVFCRVIVHLNAINNRLLETALFCSRVSRMRCFHNIPAFITNDIAEMFSRTI